MKIRDTQIALGVVPGPLRPPVSVKQNVNFNGNELDLLANDRMIRFLAANPGAIPRVIEAPDGVMFVAGGPRK